MKPSFYAEIEVETSVSRQKASRMPGRFLKGPIPMTDLWKAAKLPGHALALYLAILHQIDISGRAEVTVPSHLLRQFGIDKDAKSRALSRLSAANLICVLQQRGKSARISLFRADPAQAQAQVRS
jgi:DNA-binding transcriptional ArsR family regulator